MYKVFCFLTCIKFSVGFYELLLHSVIFHYRKKNPQMETMLLASWPWRHFKERGMENSWSPSVSMLSDFSSWMIFQNTSSDCCEIKPFTGISPLMQSPAPNSLHRAMRLVFSLGIFGTGAFPSPLIFITILTDVKCSWHVSNFDSFLQVMSCPN